jgi:hypothetical protein
VCERGAELVSDWRRKNKSKYCQQLQSHREVQGEMGSWTIPATLAATVKYSELLDCRTVGLRSLR